MSIPGNAVASRSFDDARELLHGLEVPAPAAPPPLSLTGSHLGPYPAMMPPPPLPAYVGRGGGSRLPPPNGGAAITEVAAAVARGSISARQLLEQSLDALAGTGHLGAMVHLDAASLRREADVLDTEAAAGQVRGPLHGVPVTVKDVIHVTGMPTRAGSAAYESLSPAEGTGVARLRAAGALIMGKVATHEFALGVTTPQCRNPHDPEAISGGSSGGSAIAVATGVGLASLGTDTRASLRVPAALCGVVGFKPTLGRVPIDGIVPLSWTMDHLGPIARTVADASAVLEVLAGPGGLGSGPGRTRSRPVVGVVPAILEEADGAVADAVDGALGVLSGLGCPVSVVPGPGSEDLDVANALGLLISRSEAAAFHRSQGTDLDRCIPEVRDQLRAAQEITAVDYLEAQRQRSALADRTLAALAGVDVLVTPTTPVPAPSRDDYEDYLLVLSRNAIIWSLVGSPALSLPCGAAGRLPIGVQLTAAPGAERLLARIGTMLEQALAAR
ncbi:MAG TPA: amidase [Acidimicrobiales bacterium]|nr:amidase [Acidimicrobiales bacterium]